MSAWLLYGLGITLAYATGWWLRGLRDEDGAVKAALQRAERERRECRIFIEVKPKDWPYP